MYKRQALDAHPRGSGMLVQRPSSKDIANGCVGAKAITHYTSKWPWAQEAAGKGRHLLRVSYGWANGPEIPVSVEGALKDASRLLDVYKRQTLARKDESKLITPYRKYR